MTTQKLLPFFVYLGFVVVGLALLLLVFLDPVLRYRLSEIGPTSTRTQVIEMLGPPASEIASDQIFKCIKGWDCSECKRREGLKYRWVLEYQGWSAYWIFGGPDDRVLAVVRCGS